MLKVFRLFIATLLVLGVNSCNKNEMDPMAEYIFYGTVVAEDGSPIRDIEVTCHAEGANVKNQLATTDVVGDFLIVHTCFYPTTKFKFKFEDVDAGSNGQFEPLDGYEIIVSDSDFTYKKKKGFYRGRCEKAFKVQITQKQ